ncbi:MAG: hypothetical protein ABH834_04070 [Candidatus Altiarchaeota archaeon]
MSVRLKAPVLDAPPSEEHGMSTRILFAYDRRDESRMGLLRVIMDEGRWDVTACHVDDAETAFSGQDILIVDRATLIPDLLREGERVYKSDALVSRIKGEGRNPDVAVMVVSNVDDPGVVEGDSDLTGQDRFYRESVMDKVDDYFKYPFDTELFLIRLRRLDVNLE